MSVITSLPKRPTNTTRAAQNSTETKDEFDGFWINPGVSMQTSEDEGDTRFVRLPRGIAVSDLKTRKIYDTMSEDFAAEVALMNSVIALIQKKCATLDEGESIPLNLELVLYRRKEESEVVPDREETASLEKSLFG